MKKHVSILPIVLGLAAGLSPATSALCDDLPGVTASSDVNSATAQEAEQAGGKGRRLPPVLDFDGSEDSGAEGPDGKPVGQFVKPDEVKPSRGMNVFERMGAGLPPLPPEKEFTGKIDEAFGAFQRGLYLTALDLALPRAQLGDAAAQTLLAEITSQGLGVKRDPQAAAFWYEKGAEGGDPNAMFKYALILMEGRFAQHDKDKADELMRKAADAGNPLAQFNWAQILVTQTPGVKGLRDALPYYEKSAEKGIADAQYALSQIYLNLPGLPEEKRSRAKEWLLRAAKAGYDTAQFDMGVWLINGTEFERDYEAGFRWMRLAALNGHVLAANKLAHLYINAIGTGPDPVEAAKWYIIARRAGLEDPALEDFYLGISEEKQKAALEAANNVRRR